MNHDQIKGMFPILRRTVNGHHLVYLDSAASAQKPLLVTDAMKEFSEKSYANVHRGIHYLAEEATEKYEEARSKIAQFIRAKPDEVVFTSGTTASINMVARSLSFEKGDEIVVSIMEHHSNFVPWQQIAKKQGLTLQVIPITPDYMLDMDAAKKLITEKTKLVAICHVSNVLGTINPLDDLIAFAHEKGAMVLVDGAQAVPHMRIDMRALDVDFYAFSGHKMYGPTGIGVLYGKESLLEKLEPSVYGGEMVKEVTVEKTTWNDLPWKFEAGTPNIIGAIGLGYAVDFMQSISYEAIMKHEQMLLEYTLQQLKNVEGLTVIGPQTCEHRGGAVSFTFEDVHPHDVAAVLDEDGIAVRAGHHCANVLHCSIGLDASTRASMGIYNTKEDVDRLVASLAKVKRVFS